MALELHAAELPTASDRESLDVALRQLHLMETSLKRFLHLGRGERLPSQSVSLGQLIDETLPLVEPACRHANIRLQWNRPDVEGIVTGEPDSLRQLLLNLLVNAIEAATDATGKPGMIRVELDRAATDAASSGATQVGMHEVRLRVIDSGPGPDKQMSTRLFEPFATSKPDGTGLGLSVAREIAEAHSAQLTWQRRDGTTCFEVHFESPGS